MKSNALLTETAFYRAI